MTDSKALRDAINASGISITFIAEQIGITREGFYKKMRGDTEFKASEIGKIMRILHLTAEQRDAIFFAI